MANEVRIGVSVADHASGPIDKIRDSFANFGNQAKKGLMEGVGIGAGLEAVNLVKRGVEEFKDVLQDSARAAIDDQNSQNQLGASLKANIPNWDGNTRAIEASLEAGMKKGFTDEEQRSSLSLLVGATHDVNKALDVQNVAMDLARFKHIDLQTASEALTKVEAGRFRILASLGIVLKDGATATDALAAVEAVAAGQADAFGDSTEGAMKRADIAIHEAEETLGYLLLPAMKAGADFITDTFVPTLRGFGQELQDAGKGAGDLGRTFTEGWLGLKGATGEVKGGVDDLGSAILDGLLPIHRLNSAMDDSIRTMKEQAAAVQSLGTEFRDLDKIDAPSDPYAGWVKSQHDLDATLPGFMVNSFGRMADAIMGDNDRIERSFGGIHGTVDVTRQSFGRVADAGAAMGRELIPALDGIPQRLAHVPEIVHQTLVIPFGEAHHKILSEVEMTFAGIAARIATGRDQIAKAISGATDAIFDPKIVKAQIRTLFDQLNDPELTKNLGAKDSTTRHDAELRQLELRKQLADLQAEYTKFGTDASRAAKLAAELVNKNLLAGLKSPDPVQRAAAQEATKGIVDELSKLKGASFLFGRNTGNAYADGLRASAAEIANAARAAVGGAVGGLRAASPPGPESPLHKIGDWGYATGAHYAERFGDGIDSVRAIMAGTLGKVSHGLSGAHGGGAAGHGSFAMAGHGGNTYNLNLDGRALMRIVGQHEWIDDRLLHGAMRPGMAQ